MSVKFCGGIEGIEGIDRIDRIEGIDRIDRIDKIEGIEGRSYIFFFAEACCGAGGEAGIVEHELDVGLEAQTSGDVLHLGQ